MSVSPIVDALFKLIQHGRAMVFRRLEMRVVGFDDAFNRVQAGF
jgi:hypothetical protein